jgi:hypothetical protein
MENRAQNGSNEEDDDDDLKMNEIYCRWCGEGQGELLLCDSCPKSFCSGCITRNFGNVPANTCLLISKIFILINFCLVRAPAYNELIQKMELFRLFSTTSA